jgi:hypothetical protein
MEEGMKWIDTIEGEVAAFVDVGTIYGGKSL